MKRRVYIKSLVFLTVFAALLIAHGTAAAHPANGNDDLDCRHGRAPVGDLGIAGMKFKGKFYMDVDKGEHWWLFQAEPKILDIDPNGPAMGILRSGDVLLAIDDLAITTRQAGRRFGNLPPGKPVAVTVRRGGRRHTYEIKPVAVCMEDHPLHLRAPEPPDIEASQLELEAIRERLEKLALDVPELPEIPAVPALPDLSRLDIRPRAWFGLGISCDGCTIRTGKDGGSARWEFDNPPTVHSVDPGGPADEAGLRKGDVLTHIDGIRIDTRKGSQRFSSVEPGETVTWKIKRGTQYKTVEMHALEHPESVTGVAPKRATPVPRPAVPIESSPVRFSGVLGGTDIEVRGSGSVDVTRDDESGVIVIRTRDAVIRLQLTDKSE
ncbi:MAG: PDZ domain-containing protein [Candidatus Latescibacterota bacterium]|nr:MAG: PDZ domain-containing protein [Candidatus Latescibacterota bacterium]